MNNAKMISICRASNSITYADGTTEQLYKKNNQYVLVSTQLVRLAQFIKTAAIQLNDTRKELQDTQVILNALMQEYETTAQERNKT